MKSKILAILFAIPSIIFGQYVQIPRYDSEYTAKHIMMGDLKSFCHDTIEFVVEKPGNRWITSHISPESASKKVWKILQKGKSHFTGSTNRGYTFYISVVDVEDEYKLYESLTFHVDPFTMEIFMIEIKL